jgi:hypothetical protein
MKKPKRVTLLEDVLIDFLETLLRKQSESQDPSEKRQPSEAISPIIPILSVQSAVLAN